MAYSDFTPEQLINKFGVSFRSEELFPVVSDLPPSDWLIEALQRANDLGFGSEKSRSERLVTPILLELSNRNRRNFSIISGANLDIDSATGLNGECDFIFSFSRIQDFLMAPVFCITEAKKQDLEQGTVQCAAQLIGASRLNERDGKFIKTLYGCSTTGVEWRFIRYENNEFVVDETRYLISDIGRLLGVLQIVVEKAKQAASAL